MQFLVLADNRFWFYILLIYLGYRTIQLWCCVSFFGIFFVVAGKWFWRKIGSFVVVAGKFYYDRKKKIQSSVWRVRDHYYDREKKDTVIYLAGARSLIRPEKKDTVVCLAGARSCLSFLSRSLYLH